jgi:catalase-peroxidase
VRSKTATPGVYDGRGNSSGAAKWMATPLDPFIGSTGESRAVTKVHAEDDAKEKFVTDLIAAWTNVMNADCL